MSTYTIYIVSRSREHHYVRIMGNNGKAILNEPVKRAKSLEDTVEGLITAIALQKGSMKGKHFSVERISEKEFRAKFPQFAPNKGPKKVAKKVRPFKVGDLVVNPKRFPEGYDSPDYFLEWDNEMNGDVGEVQKVIQVCKDGDIETPSWFYRPEWLRHATPAEVRKFNAQKGKA